MRHPSIPGQARFVKYESKQKAFCFFGRTLKVGIFAPYRTCSPFFQTAVP